MMTRPKDVRFYVTEDGHVTVEEWLSAIEDQRARTAIDARIARLRLGLVGHVRELGEGVHELKIGVGQGYRVYFGNVSNVVVLLLCGGIKRTQKGDIKRAKELWNDYQQRSKVKR